MDNGPAPAEAAAETIEFAGVSTLGDTTHLIFHDKAAKKNRWIKIGETVEGISVLKFDARLNEAVVKVNGVDKRLALRKGTGPVNSPAQIAPLPPPPTFVQPLAQPVVNVTPARPISNPPSNAGTSIATSAPTATAPANPPAPATPESQARQETEARMLVSDLLEIGMAQRKAYEEAHRRAAEGKQAPANQTPPANP